MSTSERPADLRSWLSTEAGLNGARLESTLEKCRVGEIFSLEEMRELAAIPEVFKDQFPASLTRFKIAEALAKDNSNRDAVQTDNSIQNFNEAPTPQPAKIGGVQGLPEGKRYPFFASHKKSHTRFGDASADLARATKDIIKLKANLEGYFDADNLKKISKEQLSLGIVQSCSVLLFLNDETLDSAWCRHEVDEARAYGIPIICVVDSDKQTQREVIDCYMEKGFGWLFDSQVISYNSQGRDHAIDLIISAIRSAIEYCASHDTLTSTTTEVKESTEPEDKQEKADVHESDAADDTAELESQLKEAVIAAFGSARAAFDAYSKDGAVGKKEFKKLVKKCLPSLKPAEAKRLRRSLPNRLSSVDFCSYIGGPEDAGSSIDKGSKSKKGKEADPSGLASLPPEVPELPPSFRPRLHAQEQLLSALLAREGARSTAVTAPKSRISSQGMGGVGKTMLTAAVVRDERLRAGFKTICWLNLSQQPEIMPLQRQLYSQLQDNDTMPDKVTATIENQLRELRKVAAKRLILVVLDDMWDTEHERPFSCIDPATASKLLVTTRIKGIMSKGLEVELELLGVKESVELLAAVAEIDADQTPPCCLEIAQLCGRLPLCLNIVGNLIRTYGSGWEEEIPSILKKDMKSLTAGEGAAASTEHQSLNLQQRVIQSGLDSLAGADAADIVSLFKGMAVFAEDQIIPVAILSVLWVSIDPEEHKPLSGMKVRQWVSQLLSRSIILGSATDGVSMHDIVRDFTLASQADSGLEKLQRRFAMVVLEEYSKGSSQAPKSTKILQMYATSALTHHLKSAITLPLCDDKIARKVLLHDDAIINQALQSVKRPDVVNLALWYASEGKDYFSACRLWSSLAWKCKGVDLMDKLSYMRSCLLLLQQHVPDSQPGANDLKGLVISRLRRMTTDQSESASLLKLMISWARKKDNSAPPRITFVSGLVLLGIYESLYAIDRSRETLLEGAEMMFSANVADVQTVKQLSPSFAKMVLMQTVQFTAHNMVVLASISNQWSRNAERMMGTAGELLLEASAMYSTESFSQYITQNELDYTHMHGDGFMPLLCKYADTPTSKSQLSIWEAIDTELLQNRNLQPLFFVATVWPLLQIAPGALARAIHRSDVHFSNASTWAATFTCGSFRWSVQGDGGNCASAGESDSFAEFVKALFAAEVINLVSQTEIMEWLPQVDYRPVHDRYVAEIGLGVTLSTLLATAAANVGMYQAGMRHNQYWLGISLNPVKKDHAHMSLAAALAMERKAGPEERE